MFIGSSYRHLCQLFIADNVNYFVLSTFSTKTIFLYLYKYFEAIKKLECVNSIQSTTLNLVIRTEFYQPRHGSEFMQYKDTFDTVQAANLIVWPCDSNITGK